MPSLKNIINIVKFYVTFVKLKLFKFPNISFILKTFSIVELYNILVCLKNYHFNVHAKKMFILRYEILIIIISLYL